MKSPLTANFEQYDFGSPEHCPKTPAALLAYVTEMFRTHFLSQPTPPPALHDGTLRWDDILHRTHENFQRHHVDLRIPGSVRSCPDTLHVLC